ncbi:PREDICTED: rab11 family-interacting protein 2 [Miniopterus natalensis]|uniref:rab11 family-interacting protein 2 n=1 Tax=Miniopterus natalensis TaxID=291302 RepID=UPI0007A6C13B|nr:PREDICTED: rab11 family-interacting protein 2 [Miniopterus natalensis]
MLLSEQAQKWFPTHVQVTVLQARDLKPKGKSGTNDTYTIIQLGKEKYSTSVAEKTLEPVWREEAAFELPGLLVRGSPDKYVLLLVVMHRSLVGLDKFLGQVAINLNDIFEDKQRRKTEWFRLESKQGKRAKTRGEIKVSIQFMRNNMTASMFDLSMKDKTRSPFAKLKDKMKGRKNDGTFSDTSSAIIPSSHVTDANSEFSSGEMQMKSKPKKPFLLGPQRLSSAHSMSDLTGAHVSSEKLKSGTTGQTHLLGRQIESFGAVPESGSPRSPHRRTLSFDTCKASQARGADQGPSAPGRQSDPFTNVTASLPQKFATLPRKKNPFEDSSEPWDNGVTLFAKSVDVRKESKREKREKVSLLERVTGRKEGRRPEKLGSGAGSPGLLKSPSAFSENRQDYFDYESTNPFTAKFRASNIVPSSSFHTNPTSSEDLRKIPDSNPFDATAGYRSLTYEEVLQELVKHRELLRRKDTHIRELEDYIDNLLVRVMEETPSILRVPYEPSRRAGKFSST